ncbi:conserved domain protein [Acidobacterium capsulatum ATCC 51196]|uniref:Conserved domain protein n=1 Tax=Acidobacterium capsulatum (strain ATCC 51196 / DSM 11244 / BCRC 80197 / JCM 7670 / NBRC 15755 / NCIMB 13165 / 161) TaxID=240015 RepID=C1F7C1_ACIC5|nr:conserved domain protein [Acidobacterium capsulatum ATCC 51196]
MRGRAAGLHIRWRHEKVSSSKDACYQSAAGLRRVATASARLRPITTIEAEGLGSP